ncbi:MAG: AAA family ATPase [Desulfitobacteriaceae bacterium]|nr:AAA family ATPase [Desulfitobacteriaceae bacterium]
MNYELQSLLRGYFTRPNWEEQIAIRLQQYAGVFVYGPAGVGKTTLGAQIAQQSGGAFYSYSVANKGKLVARNAT